MKLNNQLSTELAATLELQEHWDQKLSRIYPIAPYDLFILGFITSSNYAEQSSQLGRFSTDCMVERLTLLSRESGFLQLIRRGINVAEVLGIGEAYDLSWMLTAQQLGLKLGVVDVSKVAWDNIRQFSRVNQIKLVVKKTEVEEYLESRLPHLRKILVRYAGRFIQVQPPEKMQRIMRNLATWLHQPTGDGLPQRKLWALHAYRKDNNTAKVWRDEQLGKEVKLPYVMWGDTTPYDSEELLAPADEAGLPLNLVVLHKKNYFHQTYSFVEFSAKKAA